MGQLINRNVQQLNFLLSAMYPGADPGFLKGGGQIRSTSKKGGGRRVSNFGPNVKKPTSWHKGGVRTPPPLWIRYWYLKLEFHRENRQHLA